MPSDNCIIAVKGTSDISDVLADLTWWPKTYNQQGAQVHGGFAACAAKLYKRVSRWVREKPGSRITFCGHSMGGSVAALLAYKIARAANASKSNVLVVTFGAPAFSTPLFAHNYAQVVPMHIGFVIDSDPVPAFPLVSSILLEPYIHVGAQYVVAPMRARTAIFTHHRLASYRAAVLHLCDHAWPPGKDPIESKTYAAEQMDASPQTKKHTVRLMR